MPPTRVRVTADQNLEALAGQLGIPSGAYHYEPTGPDAGEMVCHIRPEVDDPQAIAAGPRRIEYPNDVDPAEVAAEHDLEPGTTWIVEGDLEDDTRGWIVERHPDPPADEPAEVNTPAALRRAVAHGEAAKVEADTELETALAELDAAGDDPDEVLQWQVNEAAGRVAKIDQALAHTHELLADAG